MKTISFTTEQANKIADEYNMHVKDDCKISSDQVHMILHDNSEEEMEDQGRTVIEISKYDTLTGNPVTLDIYAKEVTFKTID